MHLASAVFLNHLAVEYRAIAFVQIKAILGIFFVERAHELVAPDFSYDGCRRNQRYFFIAIDNGFLIRGYALRQEQPAVKQDAVTGRRRAAAP